MKIEILELMHYFRVISSHFIGNDIIFGTFRHSWFLCFQAVKGTFKGTELPRFSSLFELKTTHPLLIFCPSHRPSRRYEGQLLFCITIDNFPTLDEPFYALINCNASMKTCSFFHVCHKAFIAVCFTRNFQPMLISANIFPWFNIVFVS